MIQRISATHQLLDEILKTLKGRYPQATQTWGCQPILTVRTSGGKPLMLFFTPEYASENEFPQGQGIYVPTRPFRFLILLNEGNADIMFDFNWKPGNMRFSSLLRGQEDFQLEAKGEERIWSFGAYAVSAGGPNPSANASNWNSDPTTAHLRIIAVT